MFLKDREIPKFLLVGLANTIATYLLYLILIRFMEYVYAFSVMYIAGIMSSYVLNSLIVFKVSLNLRRASYFTLIHVINYYIGLNLMGFFVLGNYLSPEIAPLAVLAITVPIFYLALKRVIN